MRTLKNLVFALGLLALGACTGLSARQEALLPALRLAWPGVETDVRSGIEESALSNRLPPPAIEVQRSALARLGQALAAGDPPTLATVDWTALSDSANHGLNQRVARGEISLGVSGSLRERLRNFGEGLSVFLERR